MTYIGVPDGVILDGIRLKTRNDVINVESLKAWSEPIRTVGNKQRGDRVNSDFWVQEDWTGGLGYHTHKGSATDPENTHPSIRGFFDSTVETRWEGQVTLAEEIDTVTQTSSDDFFRFVEAGTEIFAFSENANESIGVYADAVPNWGEELDMSGAGYNSLIPYAVFEHNGDVFAFGGIQSTDTVAASGLRWTGGAWAQFTPATTNLHQVARSGISHQDIMYVATYDTGDDLIRIESSTNDGDTWAVIAGMEITETNGDTIELVSYFDAAGTPAVYLHTDTGLYLLDIANSDLLTVVKFSQKVKLAQTIVHNTGRPLVWNGLLYLPRGQALIEFHFSGAWRDISFLTQAKVPSGIKANFASFIGALTASDQWLFVGVSQSGKNSIWAYDGEGYHYIWSVTSTGAAGQTNALRDIAIHHNGSLNLDELHIVYDNAGSHVHHRLPYVLADPVETSAKRFEASGYLITPWFDAGMTEVDTAILATAMGFQDVDASETIKVETAVDFSSSYETGDSTKTFDNTDTSGDTFKYQSGAGFAGKTWRHKYTFAGDGATSTPVMFYPITYFEKVFTDLHKYTFEVDVKATLLLGGPSYASEQDILKALETSHDKVPLLAFAYGGTAIHSGGTTRYVRIDNMPHVDRPGDSGEAYGGAEVGEAFIQVEIGERI